MESKEEVINRVYYDQAGHGSMKKTNKHANNQNKDITEAISISGAIKLSSKFSRLSL